MMLQNIPFMYINVTALSCFTLMFVTFLATKKTPEIWAFLAVLLDAILWSGGSILMRMQMWPGLTFWYRVSLVALFSMELLFYIFVHTFARRKGKFLLAIFTVWTLATIPGTISGFYLSPPEPVVPGRRLHGLSVQPELAHCDSLHHVCHHHWRNGSAATAGDAGTGGSFLRHSGHFYRRPCDAGGKSPPGGAAVQHLSL